MFSLPVPLQKDFYDPDQWSVKSSFYSKKQFYSSVSVINLYVSFI